MKGRRLTYLLNGAGILAISGCASTQVNYNTLDIASTYDTLITKQIVFNIFKALENRFGVPAYVKVTAQSAGSTDGVNPTLAIPFSPQTTLTQTAASLVTGKSLQTAARGLSLQVQAQWNQTYTLSPVDDPDQLRRLRSIYQYVTGQLTKRQFESDYPIIAVSGASGSSSSNTTIVSGSFAGSPFKVTIGGNNPPSGNKKETTYFRPACATTNAETGQCTSFFWLSIKPDLTFIKPPGCVMCDFGNHVPELPPNAVILEKNPNLVGLPQYRGDTTACSENDVFFYRPDEPLGSDAIAIPSNGANTLYVRGQCGLQAFYELALFTQEAATQGTGSPASGGQSEGRKTEPLQRISVPVGALTTTTP
jgi:hypothetical protein